MYILSYVYTFVKICERNARVLFCRVIPIVRKTEVIEKRKALQQKSLDLQQKIEGFLLCG